jgi:hypothetical protein
VRDHTDSMKLNLTEQKCTYYYSKIIGSGPAYTRINGILENELCGTPRKSLPLMSRGRQGDCRQVHYLAVRLGERHIKRGVIWETTKWAQVWVAYPFPSQYLAHNRGPQCLGSSNCICTNATSTATPLSLFLELVRLRQSFSFPCRNE